MSSRHQDELEAQYNENFWLKKSLLECSNALHDAVALLKNVKQDQNAAPVPPILFEIAAKFNYENVVSACKCAICPTPSKAPLVHSIPVIPTITAPTNNKPAPDINPSNTSSEQEQQPAKSKPKNNNESTLALFKNLKRDVNGLYVLSSSSSSSSSTSSSFSANHIASSNSSIYK